LGIPDYSLTLVGMVSLYSLITIRRTAADA